MKTLFLFLVFFLSASANDCSLSSSLRHPSNVDSFASDVGAVFQEGPLFGCSWDQQLNYYSRLKEVGDRVDSLLAEVELYLNNDGLSSRNRAKVLSVKENLLCVKNKKINDMEIHCDPNCPTDEFAATLTSRVRFLGITFYKKVLPQIKVCVKLMDEQPKDFTGAVILHELSHHCGSKDHDRFSSASDYHFAKPTEIERWHENADHFEYWFNFPFCIPGVDCPTYEI